MVCREGLLVRGPLAPTGPWVADGFTQDAVLMVRDSGIAVTGAITRDGPALLGARRWGRHGRCCGHCRWTLGPAPILTQTLRQVIH